MQEGIYGIQTTPLVTYFLPWLFPASPLNRIVLHLYRTNTRPRAYTTAACIPHPGELRVEIELAGISDYGASNEPVLSHMCCIRLYHIQLIAQNLRMTLTLSQQSSLALSHTNLNSTRVIEAVGPLLHCRLTFDVVFLQTTASCPV